MPVRLSYPSPNAGAKNPGIKHCLVYFIPGNPGFVDYYATFLSTLRTLLDDVEKASLQSGNGVCFHVVGRNLLGFDDDDIGDGSFGPGPFGLDAQIQAALDAVAAERVDSAGSSRDGTPFDEVILMGHSVGSYISVEVFRRWQDLSKAAPDTAEAKRVAQLRLRAGILLFATLTHIAQSSRGRRVVSLLEAPLLGPYAQQLVHGFLQLWPAWALDWVLRNVLSFPLDAAAVTTRLLTNKSGVRQGMFLGLDELKTITEDKWEDEIWQVAEAADAKGDDNVPPKFVIYFGQDDHWVNDDCRDRFIASREEHASRDGPPEKRGRTQIIMDEKGLPHAFCIRHGEEVAEMVKTWISDISAHFSW